ncbi:esterase/lipase family protein, partial [Candidatus Margulisiibacteriota bacterium]
MKRNIIIFILLLLGISIFPCYGANTKGTKTYKDYLIILIHGMNGGAHHFNGTDHRDKDMRLLQYLENNLGLKGYVYTYSFTEKNGSSLWNVRELGDRNYKPSSDFKCWLDRAKQDYKKWYAKERLGKPNRIDLVPESVVPSKYIFITHSMGNMAARLYIYSKQVLNKNLYQDDVAKVVFIAPPFTGSDLAYFSLVPKTLTNYIIARNKVEAWSNLISRIMDTRNSFLIDPNAPYNTAKEVSFLFMNAPMFFDYLGGFFGTGGRRMDPIEGGAYGLLDEGTYELIPEEWHRMFGTLLTAKLDDPTKEPSYSVVYGNGAPVLDLSDAMKNKIASIMVKFGALKLSGFKNIEQYIQDFSLVNSDSIALADSLYGQITELFGNLGSEIETSMPSSKFYKLPTAQAKFVSLVFSNPAFSLTEDGDCAVPVPSAKGIFTDKLSGGQAKTFHLRNAKFYSKTFKGSFNDFLEINFPNYVTGAVAAYGTMRFFGMPHEAAMSICQWSLVTVLVDAVVKNVDDIHQNYFVHTNVMLKEYKMIETALLDTEAIFTIQDIQSDEKEDHGVTTSSLKPKEEVAAMSITAPRPAPKGFKSLKIKSIEENRIYHGNTNMSIPITIDGDRKYVTAMTFTKPPKRIEGKLNYLIPKKMKQFQYSFNFAAWKDIQNVDPVTGEFVLENLPFAEGQNVLAIRATNAVD